MGRKVAMVLKYVNKSTLSRTYFPFSKILARIHLATEKSTE